MDVYRIFFFIFQNELHINVKVGLILSALRCLLENVLAVLARKTQFAIKTNAYNEIQPKFPLTEKGMKRSSFLFCND